MPRPSGTAAPTTAERYRQMFSDAWEQFLALSETGIWQTAKEWATAAWQFFRQNLAWFGLLFIIWAGIALTMQRTRAYKNRVQRLWLFLLYFLSKRHMLIPVVHTMAKRDGLLSDAELQSLVTHREKCRSISLRRNPQARMEAEMQLSEVLYGYFERINEEGKLHENPVIERVAEDLMFIDQKLTGLQAQYNAEADEFNSKIIDSFVGRAFFRRAGFDRFQLFSTLDA